MKKNIYIVSVFFIILIFLIFQFNFFCKKHTSNLLPKWELKSVGDLEIKDTLLYVHINQKYDLHNNSIQVIDKEKGNLIKIFNNLNKNKVLYKKEDYKLKFKKKLFVDTFEKYKFLNNYQNLKVYLYYFKADFRCKTEYYSIKFLKNNNLVKEVYLNEDPIDIVSDNNSIYISDLPIEYKEKGRVSRYDFQDILKANNY